jgi:hypothetical protein
VSTEITAAPDAWPSDPPGTPGLKIGFPEVRLHASPHHRIGHTLMIALLALGLGALTVVLVVVALLATPGPPAKCPVLTCQGPPIRHPGTLSPAQSTAALRASGQQAGAAVESGTLYVDPEYRFSLRFPPQPSVVTGAGGIGLTYSFIPQAGGVAVFDVLGGPADGITPQVGLANLVASKFPNSRTAYFLPDPLVGYEPAYGLALDDEPATSDGSTQVYRILLATSQVNGFAIVVLTYGALLNPVTPSSPLFDGHPSPANLNMAYLGGDAIMNSIRFP